MVHTEWWRGLPLARVQAAVLPKSVAGLSHLLTIVGHAFIGIYFEAGTSHRGAYR